MARATVRATAVRVGWIGLGAMGRPMAARAAAAGHQVRACDADPKITARGDGVEVVATPAEAAAGAEAVVVMVATAAQAEAVLLGPDGVLPAIVAGRRDGAAPGQPGRDPGTLSPSPRPGVPDPARVPVPVPVVVTATVGPRAMGSLAAAIRDAGAVTVDAPVSGGTTRAATGDLLVMVGAEPSALDAVRPLLDALASSVVVVGPVAGDGQRLKLVNQLLAGVHIAAAGEALAFVERLGLDPATCHDVLGRGAAASFMFTDRGARMVAGQVDDVRSALDLFVKDLGLVTGEAAAHGASVPLASAAETVFRAGHDRGLGRRDDSSVIEVLRHPDPVGSDHGD